MGAAHTVTEKRYNKPDKKEAAFPKSSLIGYAFFLVRAISSKLKSPITSPTLTQPKLRE